MSNIGDTAKSRDRNAAIGGMLDVARYHREHERFHSMNGLETAMDLRRDANALKMLAERWMMPDKAEASAAVDYQDESFRAAGCADLNDRTAVAATGILFMEGESEPQEMLQVKGRLRGVSMGLAAASQWLSQKMDAAWARERALLTPELVDAVHPRFMALTRTTLTGAKLGVVARLLDVAAAALDGQDLTPPGIRKDRQGAGRLLLTTSWFIDRAAALLAEQAADLSLSDPDWTSYIRELESRRALTDSVGGASAADGPREASTSNQQRTEGKLHASSPQAGPMKGV